MPGTAMCSINVLMMRLVYDGEVSADDEVSS